MALIILIYCIKLDYFMNYLLKKTIFLPIHHKRTKLVELCQHGQRYICWRVFIIYNFLKLCTFSSAALALKTAYNPKPLFLGYNFLHSGSSTCMIDTKRFSSQSLFTLYLQFLWHGILCSKEWCKKNYLSILVLVQL